MAREFTVVIERDKDGSSSVAHWCCPAGTACRPLVVQYNRRHYAQSR